MESWNTDTEQVKKSDLCGQSNAAGSDVRMRAAGPLDLHRKKNR